MSTYTVNRDAFESTLRKNGITKQELSSILGKSTGYISSMIRNPMKCTTVTPIADILGVELECIFDEVDDEMDENLETSNGKKIEVNVGSENDRRDAIAQKLNESELIGKEKWDAFSEVVEPVTKETRWGIVTPEGRITMGNDTKLEYHPSKILEPDNKPAPVPELPVFKNKNDALREVRWALQDLRTLLFDAWMSDRDYIPVSEIKKVYNKMEENLR